MKNPFSIFLELSLLPIRVSISKHADSDSQNERGMKGEIPRDLHNLTPNQLNEHFCNIPPPDPNVVSDTVNDILSRPANLSPFSFKPVTPEEVEKAVGRVKSSATGVDGISIVLLRHILPYIRMPLTFIINTSFDSSTFPDTGHSADDRKQTLITLLDFSLAFNNSSVPEILLVKLKSLGFSAEAIAWVRQYLLGRMQRVVI